VDEARERLRGGARGDVQGVEPQRRDPALCIAGESECATGSPATASIRVEPPERAASAAVLLVAGARTRRVLSATIRSITRESSPSSWSYVAR